MSLRAFLLELTMKDKRKIGISSCLLGNNVRYDGGSRLDQYLRDTFGQDVEWVPVCPEVEAGLGVPREAMHLLGDRAAPRLVTIRTGIDYTDQLMRWAQDKLYLLSQLDIRGFVLKARSPSCGVRDAELVTSAGTPIGRTAGLFAAALMLRFPDMPVDDEDRMRDDTVQKIFMKLACASQQR
jgi:uncharacterized protein YbbK (DUF523 family)